MAAGADGFLDKPIEPCRVPGGDPFRPAPDAAPKGLRVLPDDMIAAIPRFMRRSGPCGRGAVASRRYRRHRLYRPLSWPGVARSAHDRMLEDAATTLARDHSEGKALATDLARISERAWNGNSGSGVLIRDAGQCPAPWRRRSSMSRPLASLGIEIPGASHASWARASAESHSLSMIANGQDRDCGPW